VAEWERRCYSDGIPDEIPELLSKTLRVPCYKTIAIALLKNDLQLKSLGFSGDHSKWADYFRREHIAKKSSQLNLI